MVMVMAAQEQQKHGGCTTTTRSGSSGPNVSEHDSVVVNVVGKCDGSGSGGAGWSSKVAFLGQIGLASSCMHQGHLDIKEEEEEEGAGPEHAILGRMYGFRLFLLDRARQEAQVALALHQTQQTPLNTSQSDPESMHEPTRHAAFSQFREAQQTPEADQEQGSGSPQVERQTSSEQTSSEQPPAQLQRSLSPPQALSRTRPVVPTAPLSPPTQSRDVNTAGAHAPHQAKSVFSLSYLFQNAEHHAMPSKPGLPVPLTCLTSHAEFAAYLDRAPTLRHLVTQWSPPNDAETAQVLDSRALEEPAPTMHTLQRHASAPTPTNPPHDENSTTRIGLPPPLYASSRMCPRPPTCTHRIPCHSSTPPIGLPSAHKLTRTFRARHQVLPRQLKSCTSRLRMPRNIIKWLPCATICTEAILHMRKALSMLYRAVKLRRAQEAALRRAVQLAPNDTIFLSSVMIPGLLDLCLSVLPFDAEEYYADLLFVTQQLTRRRFFAQALPLVLKLRAHATSDRAIVWVEHVKCLCALGLRSETAKSLLQAAQQNWKLSAEKLSANSGAWHAIDNANGPSCGRIHLKQGNSPCFRLRCSSNYGYELHSSVPGKLVQQHWKAGRKDEVVAVGLPMCKYYVKHVMMGLSSTLNGFALFTPLIDSDLVWPVHLVFRTVEALLELERGLEGAAILMRLLTAMGPEQTVAVRARFLYIIALAQSGRISLALRESMALLNQHHDLPRLWTMHMGLLHSAIGPVGTALPAYERAREAASEVATRLPALDKKMLDGTAVDTLRVTASYDHPCDALFVRDRSLCRQVAKMTDATTPAPADLTQLRGEVTFNMARTLANADAVPQARQVVRNEIVW
ncbi:uncharacterized protein MONBRDRAFT_35902 [Monosiga brevicollis MX1]|uniref:Uncharacterized protein n=1 Tax=Monosiga brevicollis TaxID=81824 RepID=A9USH4_MONBE|nr:uncharacterized protein MONBRDRAFT_35902 [Monosiga brevicollis MX1]EDQ91782.1 predicted protein [Monosiga brevicollis MX1]|eukprot:XP_001743068.1 hypothetical protein [Monosiga brevicollis MX1]